MRSLLFAASAKACIGRSSFFRQHEEVGESLCEPYAVRVARTVFSRGAFQFQGIQSGKSGYMLGQASSGDGFIREASACALMAFRIIRVVLPSPLCFENFDSERKEKGII